MERGKLVAFVDEPTVHTWISRLLASLVDPMFPLVPRGLSKGLKPEIPSRASVPGAQPEIASKAVREDIEDRLHGQAAEHRCSGRARRQFARDAFFPLHPGLD